MGRSKSLWDITNKPSTKSKLELLKKCFGIWIKIWNKQNWAEKELYVIDLFAGKGEYIDCHKAVSGSPLIFLEVIAELQSNLNPEIKINLFFVEKNREYFNSLEKKVKVLEFSIIHVSLHLIIYCLSCLLLNKKGGKCAVHKVFPVQHQGS